MRLKLRLNKENLPSGCAFTEPKTGKVFDAYEQGILNTVSNIIQHRMSNKAIFPRDNPNLFDPREVIQEVFEAAHAKRPELFVGFDAVVVNGVPSINLKPLTACAACGSSDYEPEYCPTCSGKRQIGWRCVRCQIVRQG